MIKLIAFDLDETLFNDNHNIDSKNYEYIQKAKDLGVHMIPASGRGPGFVGDLYNELNLKDDNCYSILANGATVVKNGSEDAITSHEVSKAYAKKLFDYGKEKNLCIHVYTDDGIFIYNLFDKEREFTDNYKENLIEVEEYDFSKIEDKKILKIIYCDFDMDYLKSLEKEVAQLTDYKIEISYSSNRYMELNKIGISKATGLIDLCKYLDIDIEDTIAIGDNFNDLKMIDKAGIGIAVRNALDEIKDVADYITQSNNNENAVAEVIEKFVLEEV